MIQHCVLMIMVKIRKIPIAPHLTPNVQGYKTTFTQTGDLTSHPLLPSEMIYQLSYLGWSCLSNLQAYILSSLQKLLVKDFHHQTLH